MDKGKPTLSYQCTLKCQPTHLKAGHNMFGQNCITAKTLTKILNEDWERTALKVGVFMKERMRLFQTMRKHEFLIP